MANLEKVMLQCEQAIDSGESVTDYSFYFDVLSLLKEQEWISIKERIPDKQDYYLVSGGGEVWICEMLILGNIKGWSNSALRPCVEAWMPFPEPYKKGW